MTLNQIKEASLKIFKRNIKYMDNIKKDCNIVLPCKKYFMFKVIKKDFTIHKIENIINGLLKKIWFVKAFTIPCLEYYRLETEIADGIKGLIVYQRYWPFSVFDKFKS